ncbi:glycoside hydrolase family 55 protein [Stipitochalara longipes BDJ]|nr:glycoside hydrolase family 55 protein [Stipitochalara longipes BDJ]
MKLIHTIPFLLFVLGAVSVQLPIPEVDRVVATVLNDFEQYVDQNGSHSDDTAISKRQSAPYWYETVTHQGISAFGPSGYEVFRNVKDYGAKGDGVTDDTAAINSAINSGGRCGKGCASSTTTPAVVYFPSGTYLISSSIIDQYYTQLVGNPNDPPTLKATAKFHGFGLIDGDKYYSANLNWVSTNVFCRQIRNFVFDLTDIPGTSSATGIHWPTAQATSLQNVVFQMSAEVGTKHVGLFCESGSAGFLTDVTFNGGFIGAQVGNQQFTMRNLTFNNCVTAISQIWNWGWVYQGISINNCQKGIDMSTGNATWKSVGSMILIDSSITNTPIGIITAYDPPSSALPTAGSLIVENVELNNVPTAVQSNGNTVLVGTTGSSTIAAWGEGHEYSPTGPKSFQGPFTPNFRPNSLVNDGKYYVRSKPQYNTLSTSSISSVRSGGATGDGKTDDTAALQKVIDSATAAGNVVFFDAGTYLVTSTLLIPAGAKLVGEAYSVIMSSGSFFNTNAPQPVVRVGTSGSTGQVEWSDMIVATQGPQAGAILIEWNLATSGTPSGMWDVHTRIGGFAGSDLQVAQCEKNPSSTTIVNSCVGGFMSMHITASASGLYMENNWLWTADHDIDDPANTQITIYNGRGLFIESTLGTFWLVGTAVEHHTLYQYQLANTQNIYMGFIQTETPYYQPNPQAPAPFAPVATLNDPTFSNCAGQPSNCYDAWGLRIVDSENVLIYGAGHYSFFNNYGATCNVGGSPENCQLNIVDLEGTLTNVNIYCLNTVGTVNMVSEAGKSLALYSDNVNVFPDNIALFRLAASSGGSGPAPGSTVIPTTLVPLSSAPASSILTTSIPIWKSLGCYTDNDGGRALKGYPVPGGPKAMTIELCQSTCLGLGYVLAGVEYADECYCGNSIKYNNGPAPDENAKCNMPCDGNPDETCGGPNRLNLYSLGAVNAPTGTLTPTTTSTHTSSVASASTTETGDATWHFRGCYTDSVARTLTYSSPITDSMTVEACQSICYERGYILAGIEYSDQCYCDNSIHNGGNLAPEGDIFCNMPCSGNSSQICGGNSRLVVYAYGFGNGTA